MMKEKYLLAYLDMTERFSETSEAKRLKVGACLIKEGNPVAFGVNGTIPGWHTNTCEDEDGKTTPNVVLHAEINALNKCRKTSTSTIGADLIVTHSPCLPCSLEIIDAGIRKVYYKHDYRDDSGIKKLREHGIPVFKMEDK